jgi:hypothetical protein
MIALAKEDGEVQLHDFQIEEFQLCEINERPVMCIFIRK